MKAFVGLLVFCYLAAVYGAPEIGAPDEPLFDRIRRNAVFQSNTATIALDIQLEGAMKQELNIATTGAEKECIRKVKREAFAGSGKELVAETVGKILPEIFKMDSATEEQKESFMTWENYQTYKKTEWEEFKQKLGPYIPKVQKEMEACYKH